MLNLAQITITLLRAPVQRPMRTAFGTLHHRPALLIRLQDTDGAIGWGEAYCNNPPGAGEHRAQLIRNVLIPLIEAQNFHSPTHLYTHLTAKTHILSLQCGEPGPFAQCISGIDIAACDLTARKSNQPLHVALGGTPKTEIPAYLSGLDPDHPERLAEQGWAQGHRAFKLKLGFGQTLDLRNARALRAALPPNTPIALDANQVWTPDQTLEMARHLAPLNPIWLEEPLPADTPLETWQHLAQHCPIPLAAGENLRGEPAFEAAIDSQAFAVLQPDPAKWGGLSALAPLARRITAAGLRFCPHYLGGGLGLIAAAHLAAAADTPHAMVEVDENENPLRTLLATPFPEIHNGHLQLPETPGLGVEPDLQRAHPHQVLTWSHHFPPSLRGRGRGRVTHRKRGSPNPDTPPNQPRTKTRPP